MQIGGKSCGQCDTWLEAQCSLCSVVSVPVAPAVPGAPLSWLGQERRSSPVPALVSPGPTWRAGHVFRKCQSPGTPPGQARILLVLIAQRRSSGAGISQNRGSSDFRARGSQESPKGPVCASAVLARGHSLGAEPGRQKPCRKGPDG